MITVTRLPPRRRDRLSRLCVACHIEHAVYAATVAVSIGTTVAYSLCDAHAHELRERLLIAATSRESDSGAVEERRESDSGAVEERRESDT